MRSPTIAVIGSGPGGGLTACLLAESGFSVKVFEEGPDLPLDESQAYSVGEISSKYRNGGVTAGLGIPQLTYVEGCVVGGGSEINSGLYHRIPEQILEEWRSAFGLRLTSDELEPYYLANERELEVQTMPEDQVPEASRRMESGAARLGWKCLEVPRWYHNSPASHHRNSMSHTFLPRAKNAGAVIHPGHNVRLLRRRGSKWSILGITKSGAFEEQADVVFVCGGAIQTPALLQRSGFRDNVGRQFFAHPTLKITAEFLDPVNDHDVGVPPHQVKEFSPRLSFGCSISRPQFMALGLLDHPDQLPDVVNRWKHHAVYYCMLHGTSSGTVRTVPGLREPIVSYHLNRQDAVTLVDGLSKLCDLLFAAGAIKQFPTISGSPFITQENLHYWNHPERIPASKLRISTIHLLGTCPAGENANICPVSSFGEVRNADNLYVNDGSMLCTSLGVNPQGPILALARRNVTHFLNNNRMATN